MTGTAISSTNITLTWTSPSVIYFVSGNLSDPAYKAAQIFTNSIETW